MHFAGANGGQPVTRRGQEPRPRLIVDEEFDLVQVTPDLDAATFPVRRVHVTREVLDASDMKPFRFKQMLQDALLRGRYWRGPLGEHVLESGRHRMSLDPDGRVMIAYDIVERPQSPDPVLGRPVGDLSQFEPSKVQVLPLVISEIMLHHRTTSEQATEEIFALLDVAISSGKYRRESSSGRHVLEWRGFELKLAADSMTVVRYKSRHIERTPREVLTGVPSRFGAARRRNSNSRRRKKRKKSGDRPSRAKRLAIMEHLTIGDRQVGRVTDLTGIGAFIDIGGMDGFVHRSKMGGGEIPVRPDDILSKGDEVTVEIVDLDEERARVTLHLVDLPETSSSQLF